MMPPRALAPRPLPLLLLRHMRRTAPVAPPGASPLIPASSSAAATRPFPLLPRPGAAPAASMATLKEIQMRLKSITNIAKITKSMKMIASTKVPRAQRALESARVFGHAAAQFPISLLDAQSAPDSSSASAATDAAAAAAAAAAPAAKPTNKRSDLLVVVSSDRGLCGGIHSNLSRTTRRILKTSPATSTGSDTTTSTSSPLVILGDKARSQLSRDSRALISTSFNQIGKNGPTFLEASLIARRIIDQENLGNFAVGAAVYNRFKSAIAYETDVMPLHSRSVFDALQTPSLLVYDTSRETLSHYFEFQLAASIYAALTEGYASEITARRAAMDNATKNAGEIIDKLRMSYNRQRQAAITNDLVDIITGASAV